MEKVMLVFKYVMVIYPYMYTWYEKQTLAGLACFKIN